MPIKLIKACKELNIGMTTAVDFCHKHGYAAPTDPNAYIDDDIYMMMTDYFTSLKLNHRLSRQSLQSISFCNFRKFEKFPGTEMDALNFGGVNFFVGCNNAGKSTVVKATLLALENLKRIQFESGSTLTSTEIPFRFEGDGFPDVRVGDFETAINSNVRQDFSRRHEIVFELTLDKFHFTIHVVNNNDGGNRKDDEDTSRAVVSKIEVTNLKDNASAVVDLMAQKVKFTGQTILSEEQENSKALVLTTIEQLTKQLEEINGRIETSNANTMEQATLYAQKDSITERIKLSEKKLKDFADARAFTKTRDLKISSAIASNNALVKVIRGLSEDFDKKSGGSEDMKAQALYVKVMAEEISSAVSNIAIEYIPAHMAYQRTFFTMADQDYMSQVISDYAHARIPKGSREYIFLQKWLGNSKNALNQEQGLGICKDFKLKSIAGEAYQVDIKALDDSQTRLADLGMGSIQMFILLLRFATIIRKYSTAISKPAIFVEEPELNLHPNWQSRLAEVFLDLNNMGFQLIIETHSEYLIRKSQVLVANMKYTSQDDLNEHCPFKVYYFGDKDNIDMQYLLSGSFANHFGEGFYDEAAKMDMEIIQNEQQQPLRRIR